MKAGLVVGDAIWKSRNRGRGGVVRGEGHRTVKSLAVRRLLKDHLKHSTPPPPV